MALWFDDHGAVVCVMSFVFYFQLNDRPEKIRSVSEVAVISLNFF